MKANVARLRKLRKKAILKLDCTKVLNYIAQYFLPLKDSCSVVTRIKLKVQSVYLLSNYCTDTTSKKSWKYLTLNLIKPLHCNIILRHIVTNIGRSFLIGDASSDKIKRMQDIVLHSRFLQKQCFCTSFSRKCVYLKDVKDKICFLGVAIYFHDFNSIHFVHQINVRDQH